MGIPALFESRGGYRFGNVSFISGTGVPGGAGGEADAAGKGSLYLDESNGFQYQKSATGSGSDKWVKITNQADLDAAKLSMPWRDPALVKDDTVHADLAAAETAMNGGTVDGVAVVEGSRILYTNITGANANIHVVTGTPGTGATLVEDGNDASLGDALLVTDGSSAGREFTYTASGWQPINKGALDEQGFIQTFIGKSANGTETPDYASTHVVTDGDPLETAIGDLDAEVGAAVTTPHVRTAGPISDQSINLNIKAIDDAIGADVTSSKHTLAANSVNANLSILDDVLGDAKTESKTDAVSTVTTLDSVLVDEVLGAEWTVHARSTATPEKIWMGKILAVHNGTATADADDIDFNSFAILRTGSAIPSLDFDVALNGTGAAQTMILQVSSGETIDIRITRSVLNEQ